MPVNWDELRKEMSPIKDYADLSKRWREAFAYPSVTEAYNFTMDEVVEYTQRLLGEDARNRYGEYEQQLLKTFNQLYHAGVPDILNLILKTDTCDQFELLTQHTGVNEKDVIAILKYLVYWVIPSIKLLSGLVDKDSSIFNAVLVLRNLGIRTNLDILQQGLTAANRKAMVDASALSETEIGELVNRADFSRLPWASKATISNIIGAGYVSMANLANANPEQLYKDFYQYGESIGKNLKFGNEIESSYRIAKIIPKILK